MDCLLRALTSAKFKINPQRIKPLLCGLKAELFSGRPLIIFIQQLPASPTFSEFSLHNYSSNFHLGKELFLLLLFVHSCLQLKNLD